MQSPTPRSPELLTVNGKTILFVMAAQQEYGAALQERFVPLFCGVGPVESSIALTRYLASAHHKDGIPNLIVNLGSAGSSKLEQAKVYQVTKVAYRDMDASPLGFEQGCTPFTNHPRQVALPHHIEGIEGASLSTGGNIVHGSDYQAIQEDMVDMETFAIHRVCHYFDCPLIGLRGISDGDKKLATIHDWTRYLHVIDAKLGRAVDMLVDQIKCNTIKL